MIDAIAFKELYKTVYQDLYRFALCMMHHPQDAEDAVSEAVLSAYENIHKLRKESAFRSWNSYSYFRCMNVDATRIC